MPTVKVNDIDIYYEIHGNGEPLVLICGLGGDVTRWYRNIPGLSRDFRVIAFDNRGAGRSDKPDIPYSMSMMCDDIAGLMDALDIEKAHIFGISMGGMITLNFGILHPDRVMSLMPGCTRPGGSHNILGEPGSSSILSPDLIAVMSPEDRGRAFLPSLWSEAYIENNPDIVDEYIEKTSVYPQDPVGYTRQMAAADAHDVYDRLPDITAPSLVIHGSEDSLIPADNARIIAECIPGAELVVLEGLGHGFYSQEPEMVNGILIDFMKRHALS